MTAISTPEEVYNHELRQHNEERSQYEKAKSVTTVEMKEVDLGKNEEHVVAIHWHPGVAARFPWLGFLALFTMLTCIAFSVVILLTSDGMVREEWPVELKWKWITDKWKERAQLTPSVALAITNTISNVALAIAIGQGVAIAWWRKALKGATVEELHRSWSFSASVLELLTAGKAFNLIALTALTAKMALVDNLLLQKAAGTIPDFYEQRNMNIRVPTWQEQFPADWVGIFSAGGTVPGYTQAFSNVLHDYATDGAFVDSTSVNDDVYKTCKGTCYGSVPAFGFKINCIDDDPYDAYIVNKEVAENYTLQAYDPKGYSNMTFPIVGGGNSSEPPLLLSFNAVEDLYSKTSNSTLDVSGITFAVSWAQLIAASGNLSDFAADTCTLQPISRTCTLRPALLNYTVEVDRAADSPSFSSKSNNGIRLTSTTFDDLDLAASISNNQSDPLRGGQLADWNVKVIKTFPLDQTFDSNLRAWAQMMQEMFSGDVQLEYREGTGYFATGDGLSSSAIGSWWTSWQDSRSDSKSCVLSTPDPTTYIMEQLNNIAFRASVLAGTKAFYDEMYNTDGSYNSTKINEFLKVTTAIRPYVANIKAAQFSPTLSYTTSLGFMLGAIFTMFFCVLCVLPSYWGFWELGRKVTLGPMEIASAFQAPVLDHPTVSRTGGEVDILLKQVGERKVRYGEIEGSGRLAVAEPAEVRKLTVPSAHWRPGRHSAS